MKQADAQVGAKVLINNYRTSSPRYDVTRSRLGEIIETGVEHRYYVEVSDDGWRSHRENRVTQQGVRVRYRLAEFERFGLAQGDPDRAEFEEIVDLAAFMILAEGQPFIAWQQAQAERLRQFEAAKVAKAAQTATWEAFRSVGFEVTVDPKGRVIFEAHDVERLRAIVSGEVAVRWPSEVQS